MTISSYRVEGKGSVALSKDDGPEYFYKYGRIDEDHLDRSRCIFAGSRLYLSKISAFNDPFDCLFKTEFKGSEADLRQFHDEIQKRRFPGRSRKQRRFEASQWAKKSQKRKYEKWFQDEPRQWMLEKYAVCCFSTVPDDILMWSHYADGHRGFCLKFVNQLPGHQFYLKRRAGDPAFPLSPRMAPIQIQYSDEYPVFKALSDPAEDEEAERRCFLTKAKQWEYEREWRIIDDAGSGLREFPSQFLVGVIFGCAMTQKNKKRIREWCADRESAIKYYEAQQKLDAYALKLVSV